MPQTDIITPANGWAYRFIAITAGTPSSPSANVVGSVWRCSATISNGSPTFAFEVDLPTPKRLLESSLTCSGIVFGAAEGFSIGFNVGYVYTDDSVAVGSGQTAEDGQTFNVSMGAASKEVKRLRLIISAAPPDNPTSTVIDVQQFALTYSLSRVKIWTGSQWLAKPVKRWNGSAWVETVIRRSGPGGWE